MHRLLDAGPAVLIITSLIVIFTIGLDDNDNDGEKMSAYNVFNRGFRNMLGSIDTDSLLSQHLSGGLGRMLTGNVRLNEEEVSQDDNRQPNTNASRKSGKKARRKNLKIKREMQWKRWPAKVFGYVNNEGGSMANEDEVQKMVEEQRMIEEQIWMERMNS